MEKTTYKTATQLPMRFARKAADGPNPLAVSSSIMGPKHAQPRGSGKNMTEICHNNLPQAPSVPSGAHANTLTASVTQLSPKKNVWHCFAPPTSTRALRTLLDPQRTEPIHAQRTNTKDLNIPLHIHHEESVARLTDCNVVGLRAETNNVCVMTCFEETRSTRRR